MNILQGNVQTEHVTNVASLMKSFSNDTELEIRRVSAFDQDFAPCQAMMTDLETILSLMSDQDFVDRHHEIIQLKTSQLDTDTAEMIIFLVIFLVSFLLVSILLCVISRLSHLHRISLLDSLWVVSTATFLSIQHNKLASASSKLLVLGWILFCLSLLYSIIMKYFTRKVTTEQLFIVTGRNCENEEMMEYLQQEQVNIDDEKTDTVPSISLIIISASLLLSLLTLSLEMILKKLRRSKNDYDVTESGDSDTAGSDQKLLPWSGNQKAGPIRGQYSGHVISLDQ